MRSWPARAHVGCQKVCREGGASVLGIDRNRRGLAQRNRVGRENFDVVLCEKRVHDECGV